MSSLQKIKKNVKLWGKVVKLVKNIKTPLIVWGILDKIIAPLVSYFFPNLQLKKITNYIYWVCLFGFLLAVISLLAQILI